VGDKKRIKEMDRRNTCLHERAHNVVRQLKIGNLYRVGVECRGTAYSYPVERKLLDEMDRDELAKIAVVVAAGVSLRPSCAAESVTRTTRSRTTCGSGRASGDLVVSPMKSG
jgi:hypothetical protein